MLRGDGKYPLEPAGVTRYDKLTQIDASLERAISQRPSVKLQRLRTILQVVWQMTKEYARLEIAWSWVHRLAHILAQGSAPTEAEAQLVDYAANLPREGDAWLDEIAAHIGKLTRAFAPKLFAYPDQPLLPKTNNDLEVFIGQLRKIGGELLGAKYERFHFARRARRRIAIKFAQRANLADSFCGG